MIVEKMGVSSMRAFIDKCDQQYYNGSSDVHDSLYDQVKAQLKASCPDDPRLTRVGPPVMDSTHGKIRHSHPMGSLENVHTPAEFDKWWDSVLASYPHARANCSQKADGSSVSVKYVDGELKQGLTRGNHEIGDDVTSNIAMIPNVPLVAHLDERPFTGFVRGEVVLTTAAWLKLDPDQTSNARNMGNGMLMRHSGEGCDQLFFAAFRIFDADGNPIGKTETESLALLKRMGFATVSAFGPIAEVSDSAAVLAQYELYANPEYKFRDKLPYEIDGLVIKVDQYDIQEKMGEVGNCPKSQRAFKFPPRGAPGVLSDVKMQLGRCGALTPVAVFDIPVKVGGVSVSTATLHNFSIIAELDIAIGDTVMVSRMGDVIPGVSAKVSNGKDRKLIIKPKKCPFTGGQVGHLENADGTKSKVLFSLSSGDCPAVKIAHLRKWVETLEIKGLGPVYLEALFETMVDPGPKYGVIGGAPGVISPADRAGRMQRLVETPADLYRLKVDSECDAISPKIMEKVVANIQASKEIELSKFLAALGVNSLGHDRSIKIRQTLPGEFDRLEDWFSGKLEKYAKEAKLTGLIRKIGPSLKELKPVMADLLKAGVKVKEGKAKGAVVGNCFCLTGEFQQTKDSYHREIEDAGMSWAPRFTKHVTHVVSMNPHSNTKKCQEARNQGLPIIGLDELQKLLGK